MICRLSNKNIINKVEQKIQNYKIALKSPNHVEVLGVLAQDEYEKAVK